MEKVKILITDQLVGRMPEIVEEKYPEEHARIEWTMAETGDEEELSRLAPGMDIIVGARNHLKEKVLNSADKAYFIQQCSAGFDNIDLDTAKKKGITVSNSGSAGVIPVAEHTIMLMLAVAKSLPRAHNTMVNGEWIFGQLVSRVYEVYEKTLGLVGLGKIGKQTAILANGLKMNVQFYDPFVKEVSDLDFPLKSVSLEELLKTSDFLSIHTPLTDETRALIGREELRMMKPTAYVINTARGVVIDEDALADALEEGVIAGAGIDVFGVHIDPPPKEAKILNLPNVVLTPHIGGATGEDIFRNFYVTSLDNIIRVLRGEKPLYVVSEGKI
jgi:phosphoglycerate dehydrogenase-like enzyme